MLSTHLSSSPARTAPERDRARRLVDEMLRRAGSPAGGGDPTAAAARTVATVEEAFELYEGRAVPDLPADRVFVVPSLISRHDPARGPEVHHLLPLLDPRYGVSASLGQHLIAALPPLILASYGDHAGRRGVVLQAPVTADLVTDLPPGAAADRISDIVRETIAFARKRFGARVVGLGATLPAFTRFGRDATPPGRNVPVVTSGHGGTIHLIRGLTHQVLETTASGSGPVRIGVIGAAGSIGTSILTTLLSELPDTGFLACDRPTRLGRVDRVVRAAGAGARTRVTADAGEVLRMCRVTVSAITESLDLEGLVPDADLSGHVLIDDSQPGCVDRDQWLRRGAHLLWPIGTTSPAPGPLHRREGYRYGIGTGLLRSHDLWGCEAEAAALALSGDHGAALTGPVTPGAVARIGALCDGIGIRPAEPQSQGRPTPADRGTAATAGGRTVPAAGPAAARTP
ncbi:hypothetical protein ACIQ9E_08475 [Streptomyces sp. NPDC094448]|uniref:hypothetical protein n=1 Tax=Streptomyces sp. NPDC094448 TaxID=3366063 RepID=UPI0038038C39